MGLEGGRRRVKLGGDEALPGTTARAAASTTDVPTHAEWRRAERRAGARGLDGAQMRGLGTEVDLRGCRAAEALVATEVGVVVERARHLTFEVRARERLSGRTQTQDVALEREPEAFEPGVGAMVVGAARTQAQLPRADALAERVCGERAVLVEDEVTRLAVVTQRGLDEGCHVGGVVAPAERTRRACGGAPDGPASLFVGARSGTPSFGPADATAPTQATLDGQRPRA